MKLSKKLLISLVSLIILLVVAIIAIISFVNPERLKPVIMQKVKQATGRELVIDGKLSWSFFPWLGVNVGHLALGNPQGFTGKNFLEVGSAKVGVQFFPLLSGRIEAGRVELSNVQINLIKNNKGETNWAFNSAEKKSETTAPEKKSTATTINKSLALAISKFDIVDANLTYQDLQTQKSFNLRHFNLSANDVTFTHAFPIKSSFMIDSSSPAITGQFSATADVSLNPVTNIYAFNNAKFISNLKQKDKKINSELNGNLIVDLNKETFSFKKFNGKLINVKFNGGVQITHLLSDPITSGNINIEPFDLQALLKSTGVDASNIQKANGAAAQITFNINKTNTNATGYLQLADVQAAKLQLNKINAKFQWQNGILDITPVTANLYQGVANIAANINLKQTTPQINARLILTNVQAQPLINDFVGAHDISFVGQGNMTLQINTAGAEEKALTRNLNGKANFSLQNGYISGVDLGNLFDNASSFIKGQKQPAEGQGKTPFGSLTASAVIQNGVIKNQDLLLDATRFVVNGSGTIDLPIQKIDFSLQMSGKKSDPNQKDSLANLYGLPVPLTVTGQLNHPAVRLDIPRLAAAVAKKQFEKVADQATDKLKQQIGDQLPGKAGDLLNGLLGN